MMSDGRVVNVFSILMARKNLMEWEWCRPDEISANFFYYFCENVEVINLSKKKKNFTSYRF